MKDTQSDRGQLILAGAVSFALILIAIAVVFSTTLFTASVGSSGTVETVSDGTGTAQSVEHTTEEVLERVNQQNDWLLTQNRTFVDRASVPDSQLEPYLRSNMSRYDLLLAESKSETGPTYLNTTIATSQEGTRVTQNWNTLPSTLSGDMVASRWIADFAVMVNTSESSDGTVTVTATGVNGNTSAVELKDSGSTLNIRSFEGGALTQDCSITPTEDGVVYADLTSGFATATPFDPESRRHGCPVALTEGIEGPYSVTVNAGPGLHLAYDYSVNGSSSPIGSSLFSTTTEDIIWSTDVSLVYETSRVLRESTKEVSSYEP